MFNWLYNLIEKNWRAIGTHPFYYSNDEGEEVFLMSATYYINKKSGARRIKVDCDSLYRKIYPPHNHPCYHNFCVPFLRSTGDFLTESDAECMILALCDATKTVESQTIKQHAHRYRQKPKPVDNVVSFVKRDTVKKDE